MALKIHKLPLGPVQTNCYIVGDDQARDCLIIDPSNDATTILDVINSEGWTPREMLATHAHFDHVLAVHDLKAATGIPFRLHRNDLPVLENVPTITEAFLGLKVPPVPTPDGFVQEGDVIQVGSIHLEVLFTPGHAPGHVSYVLRERNIVFSGDCLFAGSIGRTDLPGSDYGTLMETIFTKLVPLGDHFSVLPGHMQNTTIGYERLNNPFLLEWMETPHR